MLTRRLILGMPLVATAVFAGLARAGAALQGADAEAVLQAERYLNRITTMRARFVQVASNGSYAEGLVTMHRPGRLRFEYDPPHPVLLIADGVNLLYYDKELKQATFIPLWQTPLWFLLRKKVELGGDVRVSDIARADGALRMTVQEGDESESGAVTLVFSDRPFALRKWEVIDAQGISTTVSLLNPAFDVKVKDELFEYRDLDLYGLKNKKDSP